MRKPFVVAALAAACLIVVAIISGPVSAADHGQNLGAKALHPQDYARAKGAANAWAAQRAPIGNGGTRGKPKPSPSPTPTSTPPPTLPAWDGQYQNNLTPGDPTGAVGPTRYIEMVNTKFGIYGRTGSLVASGTLNALTGASSSTSLSDPQILWDPLTQRFYYLVLNISTNALMYGFSTNANPSGTADFCKYYFGSYGSNLPDYPKIGTTSDFILAGVNVFNSANAFVSADVGWATKPWVNGQPTSASLAGCSGFTVAAGNIADLRNGDGSQLSTPVPAIQTDPSSSGWVVGTDDASLAASTNNYLSVFSVTRVADAPSITLAHTIPVASFAIPASARQPGTSATLDTLDARLEKAVSGVDPSSGGVNTVWTAHAVLGGAGSEERWYQIDPAAGTLLRSGKATSPSLYVWNGAISPDRAVNAALAGTYGSNMVMGFNTSSTSQAPAIQMVSQIGNAAQSAFNLVKQSSGYFYDFSCPSCRWGDYSSATPDPAATGTTGAVWLSGEYNTTGGSVFSSPWRSWNWEATP